MVTIMAAVAANNALGKDNQLIWYLPEDLKRFKKTTLNHAVIMGRKTFESLGKPLPNRTNIIITRDKNYKVEGCDVVNSLKAALKAALKVDENPYILGGAEIYKQAMPFADKLDITFVHHKFEADVFFPEIDKTIWKETWREDFKADENNKYDYSFVTFERI
jgi:dihydrofolate reductase